MRGCLSLATPPGTRTKVARLEFCDFAGKATTLSSAPAHANWARSVPTKLTWASYRRRSALEA